MDIGAIFLSLAVLILVALYVAFPFLSRQRDSRKEQPAISLLMAERDRLLNVLQELDFDHVLGKIPAEDYPAQRASLLRQGAQVLRELDASRSPSENGMQGAGDDAEARLESAIAARRADSAVQGGHAVTDEDIEALIAGRRAARKDKAAGFCPKCGKPVLQSDRFCPGCGKPLK